jgi:hypothetical protein
MYHSAGYISSSTPELPKASHDRSHRRPICRRGADAPSKPYRLEEPLPGRGQPVKAVSREAGALASASLEGLPPFRQGLLDGHSPNPRLLLNSQSTPPPGMATPDSC